MSTFDVSLQDKRLEIYTQANNTNSKLKNDAYTENYLSKNEQSSHPTEKVSNHKFEALTFCTLFRHDILIRLLYGVGCFLVFFNYIQASMFLEQFWKIFYSAVTLCIGVIIWRCNYHLSFVLLLSIYNISVSQFRKINLFTYVVLLFLISDLYFFTSNCPKTNLFYLCLSFLAIISHFCLGFFIDVSLLYSTSILFVWFLAYFIIRGQTTIQRIKLNRCITFSSC